MKREQRIFERLALCAALVITAMLCYLNTSQGEPTGKEPEPVRPVGAEHAPGEAKIYAALEKPVSFEFVEVALSDVVLALSKECDIPIVLSTRALDGVGIGTDTPVTKKLSDVPLRSALRIMLRDLDLTFLVIDEVLLITTMEESEVQLVTHLYAVRDLMEHRHDPYLDSDSLIELITANLAPSAWDEVGGPGSIDAYEGSLVVGQSKEVHEQVQALLTQLRRAKHALEHSPLKALEQSYEVSLTSSATEKKIQAALEAPTPPINFVEVALSDVASYLAEKAEIQILLDQRCLDEVGIGTDTPITATLKGISLRSALKLMLKELELVTVVRDEVMFITTVEEAESQMNTRLFLVRDLIDTDTPWRTNADTLIQLITSSVAPQMWDEVGGPGNVTYFPLIDALVFSQTEEVHHEVQILLTKLRKVRHAREPWSPEEWAARQEKLRTTVQFQELRVFTGPMNELVADPADAMIRLQNLLERELVARADMKATTQGITMYVAPADFPAVDRAIERGNLPIYRLNNSPYGFRGRFMGKGFNGGFGGGGGGGGTVGNGGAGGGSFGGGVF